MEDALRQSKRNTKKNLDVCRIFVKEEIRARLKQIGEILKKPESARSEAENEVLRQSPEEVIAYQKRARNRQLAKDRLQEIEDSEDVLEDKCRKLAEDISTAKSLVFYTGAGISTAASIPDYRGPSGVWTLLSQGIQPKCQDLSEAEPTFTHLAIAKLYAEGKLNYVVSQNCDGLHVRSGLPRHALSELHGNMYLEMCPNCRPPREYMRLFDVTERTGVRRHVTGRFCHLCDHELRDTIVHFGEKGGLKSPYNWQQAADAADEADVIVCLGTSLKVLKKYGCLWALDRPVMKRPRLYIVNLQWTPKDERAVLKINGRCDAVVQKVMKYLQMEVKPYAKENDPLFHLATPLKQNELDTTCKKILAVPPGLQPLDIVINSTQGSHGKRKPWHCPRPKASSNGPGRREATKCGRKTWMGKLGWEHYKKLFVKSTKGKPHVKQKTPIGKKDTFVHQRKRPPEQELSVEQDIKVFKFDPLDNSEGMVVPSDFGPHRDYFAPFGHSSDLDFNAPVNECVELKPPCSVACSIQVPDHCNLPGSIDHQPKVQYDPGQVDPLAQTISLAQINKGSSTGQPLVPYNSRKQQQIDVKYIESCIKQVSHCHNACTQLKEEDILLKTVSVENKPAEFVSTVSENRCEMGSSDSCIITDTKAEFTSLKNLPDAHLEPVQTENVNDVRGHEIYNTHIQAASIVSPDTETSVNNLKSPVLDSTQFPAESGKVESPLRDFKYPNLGSTQIPAAAQLTAPAPVLPPMSDPKVSATVTPPIENSIGCAEVVPPPNDPKSSDPNQILEAARLAAVRWAVAQTHPNLVQNISANQESNQIFSSGLASPQGNQTIKQLLLGSPIRSLEEVMSPAKSTHQTNFNKEKVALTDADMQKKSETVNHRAAHLLPTVKSPVRRRAKTIRQMIRERLIDRQPSREDLQQLINDGFQYSERYNSPLASAQSYWSNLHTEVSPTKYTTIRNLLCAPATQAQMVADPSTELPAEMPKPVPNQSSNLCVADMHQPAHLINTSLQLQAPAVQSCTQQSSNRPTDLQSLVNHPSTQPHVPVVGSSAQQGLKNHQPKVSCPSTQPHVVALLPLPHEDSDSTLERLCMLSGYIEDTDDIPTSLTGCIKDYETAEIPKNMPRLQSEAGDSETSKSNAAETKNTSSPLFPSGIPAASNAPVISPVSSVGMKGNSATQVVSDSTQTGLPSFALPPLSEVSRATSGSAPSTGQLSLHSYAKRPEAANSLPIINSEHLMKTDARVLELRSPPPRVPVTAYMAAVEMLSTHFTIPHSLSGTMMPVEPVVAALPTSGSHKSWTAQSTSAMVDGVSPCAKFPNIASALQQAPLIPRDHNYVAIPKSRQGTDCSKTAIYNTAEETVTVPVCKSPLASQWLHKSLVECDHNYQGRSSVCQPINVPDQNLHNNLPTQECTPDIQTVPVSSISQSSELKKELRKYVVEEKIPVDGVTQNAVLVEEKYSDTKECPLEQADESQRCRTVIDNVSCVSQKVMKSTGKYSEPVLNFSKLKTKVAQEIQVSGKTVSGPAKAINETIEQVHSKESDLHDTPGNHPSPVTPTPHEGEEPISTPHTVVSYPSPTKPCPTLNNTKCPDSENIQVTLPNANQVGTSEENCAAVQTNKKSPVATSPGWFGKGFRFKKKKK